MSQVESFNQFVSFRGITFNLVDIITVSIELDSIDGNRVLFINLNGRHEPVIYTEKVDALYSFIVTSIKSKNIDELIDKIDGYQTTDTSTLETPEKPDPVPQEPIISAKVVPEFRPQNIVDEEDEELDRRLNGTRKLST